jgi:hypothetical protein
MKYSKDALNNSFNRSANSIAFIENLGGFEVVCAARSLTFGGLTL